MTPFQPVYDPLTMPVGALAVHHDPVQTGTSIRATAVAMAEDGLHAILVADGQRLAGLVDESALLHALASGADPNAPVEEVMERDPVAIQPHMTGAEALRIFNQTGRHAIAVVDVMGNAVGVVTPSRLFHPPHTRYRPQMVGGLATPFGVYLTNGVVSGGAKPWALAFSGALLFLVFFVAAMASVGIAHALGLDVWHEGVQNAMSAVSVLLFFVGLRVIPLAGTHGAEHMVVHAIERGEELSPSVVRRMPRVHPRCGTNVAVGAMIFLGLFSWRWTAMDDVRLLVALVVTLFAWRPVGELVQYVFTTRPPNDAQLFSGIKAGKELLAASSASPRSRANLFQRIVSSGLIHVMVGATLAQLATYGLMSLLNVPESWRVLLGLV